LKSRNLIGRRSDPKRIKSRLSDCFSDKYFLEISCGRAVKLENNTKNRSISHRAAAAAAATLVRFLKENY